MTAKYHVKIDRHGNAWRAVCPALRQHGAVIGGGTRKEALVHIANAIQMILLEMASSGVSPPADEPVPGGVVLTIGEAGAFRE